MIVGNRSAGLGVRRVSVWDRLEVNGTLIVTGGKSGYVVEQFVNNIEDTLEEGDVVVIGENQTSLYYGLNSNIPIPEVDIAQRTYDTRVCGIVCEVHAALSSESSEEARPGEAKNVQPREFTPEEFATLERTTVKPGQIGTMVTLGAFAHCKVDADIAPIQVGDLLTTSPTQGHAQKVLERSQAIGAILGKALGSLDKGTGKIPVLVMLQ